LKKLKYQSKTVEFILLDVKHGTLYQQHLEMMLAET